MRVSVPLVGPSYTNRSLPLSAQVTKGLFPEINPESRNIISLNPFWGLKEFAALSGDGRGLHVMNDELYAVSGSFAYKVNSSGLETELGNVLGSGVCDFADNGTQLAIATGSTAYIIQGTLQAISDTDLVAPTTVAYLNSQFIWDQNNGTDGEFIVSDVGDASSIDALNFAQAESHPDDILKIIVNNQIVLMLGSKTVEPWFNSGSGSPPFDRIEGGVRSFGIAGPRAATANGESVYLLDDQRIPRRMVDLENVPIGNPALGAEWDQYEDVSDAIAMSFTLDQQNFFQLNFPSANRSWLYHEPSNSWSQLSYGTDNSRHRGMSYAFCYGKHLVQDHTNGKIYELDPDTYDDDGEVIQRKRATATIHGGLYGAPGYPIFFEKVEFVLQTGEGIPTGQGSDPAVMIRHSDDGGRTWSARKFYDLGRGGEYLKRIELHQQGSAYQRIYELTITDPVPVTMISAHADINVGV